jgi:trk system potassium uptake protein TrkH
MINLIPKYTIWIVISSMLFLVAIGVALLTIPGTLINGQGFSLINSIFMAASSVFSCGTTVVPFNQISTFGKIIILFLMQIGSIGFITIIIAIAIIFLKKEKNWSAIAIDTFNLFNKKSIKFFISFIFLYSILIEFFGFILYKSFAYFYGHTISIFNSLFLSVNMFCSVGFILKDNICSDFINTNIYFIISSFLMLAGGIGFLFFFEIIQFYLSIKKKDKHIFSLTFKMGLFIYLITIPIMWLFYFITCENGTFSLISISRSFFTSISMRSCGIFPYNNVNHSIIFISSLYGLFGTCPLAMGGALKSSILAIVFATIKSFYYGFKSVIIFGKKIPWKIVSLSHITIIYFLFISCFFSIIIDKLTLKSIDFLMIFADVIGIMTGSGFLWSDLVNFSDLIKIILIIVMFIGKIGVIFISFSSSSLRKKNIINQEEKLIII